METKYLKIFIYILIGILAFVVFRALMNIAKRFVNITKTEEEKELELTTQASEALSPLYFVKKIGNRSSEITEYLKKKGWSQKKVFEDARDLWRKGFGNITDNETYIYSVIRQMPSRVVVSLTSYSLKQQYGLGLDELIARNLSTSEAKTVISIINKKPEK